MRFLIADDHSLIRAGIKQLLVGIDPQAEFDDADSWETLAAVARPDANHDLAIVDLNMPGMQGVSSLQVLLKAHPALPLVVLSGEESAAEMRAALAAGALGFIPKRQSPDVMRKAIELVLSGGAYVPLEVLNGMAPSAQSAAAPDDGAPPPLSQLSPRQQEIMKLVHQGRTNKMIARELGLAEGTIKVHLSVVFRALGAHNRASAIAIINGWLQRGEMR